MTRDELIMLYYDGELDADESARVRELVERDPEAKRALARLELVGSIVAEVAEPAHSPDVAAAVLAQLFPSGATSASVPPSEESRAPVQSVRRSRPLRPLALVSGGLALAAGIAVLLGQPSATDHQRVAAPVAVVAAPEPDPPGESVAIERIDFGEDPGAIFLLPGEDERTVVIWTMDEAVDDGPEIEL